MSSLILILLIGFILLGASILVGIIFFENEPTERQIKKEQQNLSNISDPKKLITMAENYEEYNRWDAAIRTWDRYLELKPENDEAHYRRGRAYLENDQPGKAINELEPLQKEISDPPPQLPLYLARANQKRDKNLVALDYYEDYLDAFPDDLGVCREAATLARELDKPTRAREIYERLRTMDNPSHRAEGALALIEIDLEEGNPERAQQSLDEVSELFKEEQLSPRQQKGYLYQRARFQEAKGNQAKADELFRDIYGQDPDYRDVRKIVEEKIQNMSEDALIKKMLRMDRDEFVRYCEEIVKGMGYEVMQSDSFNPEEIEITAWEKAQMLKISRILFAFKKWSNQAGEIPLKEFELKLLEGQFDRGFFVCPGGFNHKAVEYAQSGRDMELIGPERLLEYLREAEKKHLT